MFPLEEGGGWTVSLFEEEGGQTVFPLEEERGWTASLFEELG